MKSVVMKDSMELRGREESRGFGGNKSEIVPSKSMPFDIELRKDGAGRPQEKNVTSAKKSVSDICPSLAFRSRVELGGGNGVASSIDFDNSRSQKSQRGSNNSPQVANFKKQ